jgi:phosphoglucosamine mutase
LGAEVTVIHNEPNGTNINAGCGSTYPEEIARCVRACGAHIGITHDGDADRALLCDENGAIVDGDEILAISAIDALERGALAHQTLVATVMSNFGLDEAVESRGGRVVRTKVGDRYVIEEMMRHGYSIGGEQSGHMIFREYSTTGDGIVSALQILRILATTGKPLSQIKACLNKYPQTQRNLKVKTKPPIEGIDGISALLSEAESSLQGQGRVLLRYSGTEPKIRLLIEGRNDTVINAHADRIADALTRAIGA